MVLRGCGVHHGPRRQAAEAGGAEVNSLAWWIVGVFGVAIIYYLIALAVTVYEMKQERKSDA